MTPKLHRNKWLRPPRSERAVTGACWFVLAICAAVFGWSVALLDTHTVRPDEWAKRAQSAPALYTQSNKLARQEVVNGEGK